MAEQYLSPQQRSRINGGQPVQNPDGSRWHRGVKVSAADAANTERTYAINAAYTAQTGQNPDRTRDPKAEGKLAEQRYLANPSRYMAEGWDGQALPSAPPKPAPNSQDRGAPSPTDWGNPPAVAAAPTAPFNVEAPGTAPTIERLPTLSMGPTQMAAEGGLIQPYMSGGYTGPGPKMKPAGVVHAGEFVIPKEEVAQFPGGVPALDAYFNTDSTKPKYGYVGGGFVLDLSKARLPAGETLPEPVRQAAMLLAKRGGKTERQILNALANGKRGWEAIMGEAALAERGFQQGEAVKSAQDAQVKFDKLYEKRVGEISSQQKTLADELTTARTTYAQSVADIEPAVRAQLKETLRALASAEGGLARLNADTTNKTVDENGFEKLEKVDGLRLNLVGDPEIDNRSLDTAVNKIMLGSNHPEIKDVSNNAIKAVAGPRAAAIQSSRSQVDAITEQMKLLGRSRDTLARDPQLAQAQDALTVAQKRAMSFGAPRASVGGQEPRALPGASDVERDSRSRAASFSGGPGSYFSPYVKDENDPSRLKKFATIREALDAAIREDPAAQLAAATGKAPMAQLAEFMAPTVAAPVAPASVVEEMPVLSADEEEQGFFPAPVPATPAAPAPVPVAPVISSPTAGDLAPLASVKGVLQRAGEGASQIIPSVGNLADAALRHGGALVEGLWSGDYRVPEKSVFTQAGESAGDAAVAAGQSLADYQKRVQDERYAADAARLAAQRQPTPSFGWGVPNQIPAGLSGEGMANWLAAQRQPTPEVAPTAPATPSFGWGVPNQIPAGLSGEGMANWLAEEARGPIPQLRAPQGNQERFDPALEARKNLPADVSRAFLSALTAGTIGMGPSGLAGVTPPTPVEVVPNTAARGAGVRGSSNFGEANAAARRASAAQDIAAAQRLMSGRPMPRGR